MKKESLFADLVRRVQLCNHCPRMDGRRRVLNSSNGNLHSPVVFVAEAPGRLGADKYGIPLYGDQSGRNFETLIAAADLKREEIFITNAVLCNPRTCKDNNSPPSSSEICNCSGYLKELLEIISPQYVVPLGAKALAALNVIKPHGMKLFEHVRKQTSWNGSELFPLYHPGPRAFIHRPWSQQIEDYRVLASHLNKLSQVA